MTIVTRIDDYCNTAGLSIARFEKLCHIGNGTIGKWRYYGAKPTVATLLKLEKATGIPLYMWLDEGER